MNFEESLKWAISQDVVKISCVKEGEDDKYIFTVGQYSVSPIVFDSQEEAEQYLRDNVKMTNLDFAIIGAMCQRINELNNEQPNANGI
jgi:hypothetical protein